MELCLYLVTLINAPNPVSHVVPRSALVGRAAFNSRFGSMVINNAARSLG